MISIKDLDRPMVLAALYNAARPQGLGFLSYKREPMSAEEARGLLAKTQYFDYLQGRVMKVSLAGDEINPRDYDADNGEGAAERVIAALRETGSVNPEAVQSQHQQGKLDAAAVVKTKILNTRDSFSVDGGIPTFHLGVPEELDEPLGDAVDKALDE